MTSKFIIIKRYNHITVSRQWEHLKTMQDWCMDPDNGQFQVHENNVFYIDEKDLTAFLLRWA